MTGASYHYPVLDAAEVTLDPTVNPITGIAGTDQLLIVEPAPGSKTYFPGEQLLEEFIVNLTRRIEADPTVARSKADAWEYVAADLEKCLTADLTRGGFACDTRLLSPAPFVGVGTNIVILFQPVRMTIYRAYRDGT